MRRGGSGSGGAGGSGAAGGSGSGGVGGSGEAGFSACSGSRRFALRGPAVVPVSRKRGGESSGIVSLYPVGVANCLQGFVLCREGDIGRGARRGTGYGWIHWATWTSSVPWRSRGRARATRFCRADTLVLYCDAAWEAARRADPKGRDLVGAFDRALLTIAWTHRRTGGRVPLAELVEQTIPRIALQPLHRRAGGARRGRARGADGG